VRLIARVLMIAALVAAPFGARFVADPPHGWHKGPPYLSQMVLRTPRMRNPKPGELWLAVGFTKWGTPRTEIKYEVFTIPPEPDPHPAHAKKPTGRGEAKARRSADRLSATFRGETADGYGSKGAWNANSPRAPAPSWPWYGARAGNERGTAARVQETAACCVAHSAAAARVETPIFR
jgi:hypothetical protein